MRLPEAIITERDAQIFSAKVAGASYRQIAKALGIAVSTAHQGYLRELKRHAKLSAESSEHAAELYMEQLDELYRQLWPMTRERTIEIDGVDVKLPPDKDAVDRVLKIMGMRAKLQGLDKQIIQIGAGAGSGPALEAGDNGKEITSETMAKDLAKQLIKHGVLEGPVAEMIERALRDQGVSLASDIEDAVLISDTDDPVVPPLGVLAAPQGDVPPPWMDDEDLDYVPGSWIPDNIETGSVFEPE